MSTPEFLVKVAVTMKKISIIKTTSSRGVRSMPDSSVSYCLRLRLDRILRFTYGQLFDLMFL